MDALFEVLNPHLPSSLLLFAAGYWAFAFSEERSLRARLAFLASMLGAWLFGGVSSLPFAFECWTRVAFGGVFMGSVLLLNGAQWFRKSKVYRQHPWALSALFGLGAGVAPPGLLCVSGQGSALTALFALLMLLTLMGSVLALLGVARWRWGRSLAFVLSGGLGLAAIAASATSIGQQFEAPKIARLGAQIDSPEAEMEEAPEAEAPAPQGERIEAPLPHELIREAGEVVALRGYSSELAAEVIGYNGHVPIAVTLSLEGEILDLELLPGHVETPGYYRAVERSSLVEQIIGKKVAEPIRVGEDIEGVTHATITSTAIAEGTKKTASRLATELAPLYLADDAAPIEVDQGETGSAFPIKYLSLLLLLALALVFERIKGQKLGWLLQITSVVVLGLWLRAFFSIQQGLDFLESVPSLLNGINPLPAFSNHPLWTLLVVTALLSSWVFGRVYCTYLCPFGALSALIGRLSPKSSRRVIRGGSAYGSSSISCCSWSRLSTRLATSPTSCSLNPLPISLALPSLRQRVARCSEACGSGC